MNKQELIEHISNTLDEYLKNTTFVKPVLSITKIAKSNKVSLEFEINKDCILLDDVSYQFGYEQGKLDGEWVGQQLKDADKIRQEINKPTIPQFVADWYEKNKNNLDYNIWNYVYEWEEQEEDEFKNWFNHSNKAFQTLVNMHQFGYEIEKEKKFLVKMKGLGHEFRVLKYNVFYNDWFTGSDRGDSEFRLHHTRKELEEANFGWVFDCPGIEIVEVK